MAIKIIKFDLPINGIKVKNLEELRDNLTDEIVSLARSGQLERWFKSRQLQEQAQAVADAVSQHAEDKAFFMALCAVLEVEVHLDDISAIFDAPPEAGHYVKNIHYFRLYEDLKSTYLKLKESSEKGIKELEEKFEENSQTRELNNSAALNFPHASLASALARLSSGLRINNSEKY